MRLSTRSNPTTLRPRDTSSHSPRSETQRHRGVEIRYSSPSMDFKNTNVTLLVLLTAALLEAGGDAIVRYGLHSSTAVSRMVLFATGALILFSYGYVVNAPPWD